MFRQVQIVLFAAVAVLTWAHANAQTSCSGGNETDVICGSLCEASCSSPRGNGPFCPPPVCIRGITSGCRCDNGYARNSSGDCVLMSDCP